jgi:hypothetical protein
MFKKLIALAAAVTCVLLLPVLAEAHTAHKSTPHVSGTIASWDDVAKRGSVKDAAGKKTSFGWTEKTSVTGTPKVGEHASVSYTKDKDGKRWATHVSIGANSAHTKPPTTK